MQYSIQHIFANREADEAMLVKFGDQTVVTASQETWERAFFELVKHAAALRDDLEYHRERSSNMVDETHRLSRQVQDVERTERDLRDHIHSISTQNSELERKVRELEAELATRPLDEKTRGNMLEALADLLRPIACKLPGGSKVDAIKWIRANAPKLYPNFGPTLGLYEAKQTMEGLCGLPIGGKVSAATAGIIVALRSDMLGLDLNWLPGHISVPSGDPDDMRDEIDF